MLDTLEVLFSQSIEHAAPELGISTNAVVGIGSELIAPMVEPLLGRAIAQILPDGRGIPNWPARGG